MIRVYPRPGVRGSGHTGAWGPGVTAEFSAWALLWPEVTLSSRLSWVGLTLRWLARFPGTHVGVKGWADLFPSSGLAEAQPSPHQVHMFPSRALPLPSSHPCNLLALVGIEFMRMCLEETEKWAEECISLVCKSSPLLLGLEDEIFILLISPPFIGGIPQSRLIS